MTGLTLDGPDGPVAGSEIAAANNIDNDISIAGNIGLLAGLLLFLRIVTLIGLKIAYRRNWL